MDLLTYLMAKKKKKIFPHKSDLLACLLSKSTWKYFYQTFTGTILSVDNTVHAPMRIELGASEISQAGTPTPSSPQDIHTISGSNKVVVCGKNLLDVSQEAQVNLGDLEYCKIGNYEDKFIRTSEKNIFDINNPMFINQPLQSDGTVWGTSSVSNVSQYIAVQPNTPYTISLTNDSNTRRICYYKSPLTGETADNTKFIKYEEYSGNSKTFTTPNECNYIRFGYYNGTDKIKLNMGASFVPNTWYIKKNIGKVVLDGSEDWTYSAPALVFFTNAYNDLFNTGVTHGANIFTNYFKAGNYGTTNNVITINEIGRIHLRIDDITSASDLQTWLSTHNTEVYSNITPTYTQITGTLAEQLENVYQKMLSYDGQTNISQVNNDLPFILECEIAMKNY